jgi:hypothetical protein
MNTEALETEAVTEPVTEALADVPDTYVADIDKAHVAAIRMNQKREAASRTFDIGEAAENDRSLHTRDNYRKVERTMQAAVDSIQDGSELALMLELEAKLQAMIDQKVAAMTDKTLPARQRFSTRELAADCGLSNVAIWNRAKAAINGRRGWGPGRTN